MGAISGVTIMVMVKNPAAAEHLGAGLLASTARKSLQDQIRTRWVLGIFSWCAECFCP